MTRSPLAAALAAAGDLPPLVAAVLALAIGLLAFVLPSLLVLETLSRKLGADLEARVGPSRAGLGGLLQPVADYFKLLAKYPSRLAGGQATRRTVAIGLLCSAAAAFSTLAVLPVADAFLAIDSEASLFIPLVAFTWWSLFAAVTAFASGRIEGTLGGHRLATQFLAGLAPTWVSVIVAGVHAGSFRWSEVALHQGFMPWNWTLFGSPPFALVGGITLVVGGVLALGLPPLDGAVATGELRIGAESGLSGPGAAGTRMIRAYSLLYLCLLASTLYLGGWTLPGWLESALLDYDARAVIAALQCALVFTKAGLLFLGLSALARVLPRARIDQVVEFSWRATAPAALFALLGAALMAVGGT